MQTEPPRLTASHEGRRNLNYTLGHHGLGYLDEPGDIGTRHIVARQSVFTGGVHTGLVNALHDPLEVVVHFLAAPRKTNAVLAHFKAGDGHTAGIGRLARGIEYLVLQEYVHA